MGFFDQLSEAAQNRALDFLVIGGLAVSFYGYSRETADLDLLIRQTDRQPWGELLSGLGYVLEHDGGTFAQFAPPQQGKWPVDLMLVREPTFAPMLAQSRHVDLYGARLRIPSVAHLLALKLHTLKHTRGQRFLKDFLDVEGLVRLNRLDLRSEKVRELFLKYGNLELYEKVVRACSND